MFCDQQFVMPCVLQGAERWPQLRGSVGCPCWEGGEDHEGRNGGGSHRSKEIRKFRELTAETHTPVDTNTAFE